MVFFNIEWDVFNKKFLECLPSEGITMGFLNLVPFVRKVIEGRPKQMGPYSFVAVPDSFPFLFTIVDMLFWIITRYKFAYMGFDCELLSSKYFNEVSGWCRPCLKSRLMCTTPMGCLTYKSLDKDFESTLFSHIPGYFIDMHN